MNVFHYSSLANLVWRMENFNIKGNYFTHFEFKWPSSENILKIYFENHGGNPCFFIISSHIQLIISGTISVVNADNSLRLLYKFRKIRVLNNYKTANLNFIQCLSQLLRANCDLPLNDTLTLFIQLWEISKEKINVTYNLRTKHFKQQVCFKWVLDTLQNDAENPSEIKYIKHIREEMIKYCNTEYSIEMTLITENFCAKNSFSTKEKDANYLTIEINTPAFIKLKLEAKAIDESDVQIISFDYNFTLERRKYQFDFESLQYLKSKREIYYPYGYITLFCYMDIIRCSPIIIERVDYISENPNISSLVGTQNICMNSLLEKNVEYDTLNQTMYKLFEEGSLCDVSLRINKDIIHCHKVVLCARSPVFKAMFQNDMREKKDGIVDIEDIDMPTLTIFIKALYTDVLDDIILEDAMKIYVAADKYDVVALKKRCRGIFLSCLLKENVCKLLELCDNYHDVDLKVELEKFFFKNTKEIINLPEWKHLMSRNTWLAAELLQQAFSQLS